MLKFDEGQRVTYIPTGEAGMVKRTNLENPAIVYVVFTCGDDWENYRMYTASACQAINLVKGWKRRPRKKS